MITRQLQDPQLSRAGIHVSSPDSTVVYPSANEPLIRQAGAGSVLLHTSKLAVSSLCERGEMPSDKDGRVVRSD